MEVRLSGALLMEVIAHHIFGILLVRRMPSRSQDSTNEGRNFGGGHLIITSTLSTYTRDTRADIQHKGVDNLLQQLSSLWGRDAGGVNIEERCSWFLICWYSAGSWIRQESLTSWSGCLLLLNHSWAPEYKPKVSWLKLIQGWGDREESLKGGGHLFGSLNILFGLGFEYTVLRL